MLTRNKLLPLIAGAVVVVTLALIAWSQADGRRPAPAAPQSSWESAAPTPSDPSTGATIALWSPPGIVATTAVEELQVFDAPDGRVVHSLSPWSAVSHPRTLLALEEKIVGDATWFHVLVPVQPNQTTGWIRAEDVSVTRTTASVHIFVAERELELWDGEELILTAPVAVGTDQTPTPPGVYSVTDPLDSTHNDTGVYGAYALGLRGFSEVLETFNGAPPQLAIHGTNEPALIGQSVSNGCIRLHNEDVLALVEHVALGTPVIIHASRDDLTVGIRD